jgi:hypothetical protein
MRACELGAAGASEPAHLGNRAPYRELNGAERDPAVGIDAPNLDQALLL